ncbi:hypothetical protein A2U01_0092941, partial [Trifolium medium]|nr:hypothetical protein [Trifolium medium]
GHGIAPSNEVLGAPTLKERTPSSTLIYPLFLDWANEVTCRVTFRGGVLSLVRDLDGDTRYFF